jgi:hypothetical protein
MTQLHSALKKTVSSNTIEAMKGQSPNLGSTFMKHIMYGDIKSGGHSGLHSMYYVEGNRIARLEGGDLSFNYELLAYDFANEEIQLIRASIGGGGQKVSSLFPRGLDYDAIKAVVSEAWRDAKIYSNVDIYQKLKAKSGLAWVGMAKIGGKRTWVGSGENGTNKSLVSAFPAVNGRFYTDALATGLTGHSLDELKGARRHYLEELRQARQQQTSNVS